MTTKSILAATLLAAAAVITSGAVARAATYNGAPGQSARWSKNQDTQPHSRDTQATHRGGSDVVTSNRDYGSYNDRGRRDYIQDRTDQDDWRSHRRPYWDRYDSFEHRRHHRRWWARWW